MSQRKGAIAVTMSKQQEEEEMELRRGPWTLEEDNLLMNYIASHGEGRWNLLARCSGLKRTGKSCRLRWLNYLKPDIKRGNLTPEEQLLILELHSKWGNRWSRIAQHLPGRTDNEIKNYWRTRVQKQARQLRVDANSPVFRDAVRCYWMPRVLEKMAAATTAHHNSHMEMEPAAAPLHPAASIGVMASSSPVHHGSQSQLLHDANNAPAIRGGYYHVADPSPSTSTTSGSGSTTAAALPPVPCFPELSWIDQYSAGGPCYDLGGSSGAFDSAALGSLGLNGLDLGPADCDYSYSDTTLLDYINATCSGSATTMLGSSGGHATDGDGAYYYGGPTTWRADELFQAAAARSVGDHQWGGGGI